MLATHAIDLGRLAGTQRFVGIETPDAFQQTLAAQDLVAAGDAPSEIVRAVEECAVAIGHTAVKRKHVAVDGPVRGCFLAALENRDRSAGPDRPVPKQPTAKPHRSTGDRTILGRISKRSNRYLGTLFMQGARVILLRPGNWARHSFGPWLTAAAKRLHHNVLATALANKLARIAWTVLAQRRNYETRVVTEAA
jgi:hypothetical protein